MDLSPRARRILLLVALVAGVVYAIWLLLRFLDSEGQVERAQEGLMNSIENRKWERLEETLHPEYLDRWELDSQTVRAALEQLRAYFFVVEIELGEPGTITLSETDPAGATAVYSATLVGKGSGVAQEIIARCNSLDKPFTFVWEKTGWRPGDWQLRKVDHPDLQVSKSEINAALEAQGEFY